LVVLLNVIQNLKMVSKCTKVTRGVRVEYSSLSLGLILVFVPKWITHEYLSVDTCCVLYVFIQ